MPPTGSAPEPAAGAPPSAPVAIMPAAGGGAARPAIAPVPAATAGVPAGPAAVTPAMPVLGCEGAVLAVLGCPQAASAMLTAHAAMPERAHCADEVVKRRSKSMANLVSAGRGSVRRRYVAYACRCGSDAARGCKFDPLRYTSRHARDQQCTSPASGHNLGELALYGSLKSFHGRYRKRHRILSRKALSSPGLGWSPPLGRRASWASRWAHRVPPLSASGSHRAPSACASPTTANN